MLPVLDVALDDDKRREELKINGEDDTEEGGIDDDE